MGSEGRFRGLSGVPRMLGEVRRSQEAADGFMGLTGGFPSFQEVLRAFQEDLWGSKGAPGSYRGVSGGFLMCSQQ